MNIRSVILCDFAQVRNQLLTVVSGGVTRVASAVFPATFSLCVAVVLEVPADELAPTPRELRVSINDPTDAQKLAEATVGFIADQLPVMEPGEPHVAQFAFDFRQLLIARPGQIDVKISAGGQTTDLVSVWFVQVGEP